MKNIATLSEFLLKHRVTKWVIIVVLALVLMRTFPQALFLLVLALGVNYLNELRNLPKVLPVQDEGTNIATSPQDSQKQVNMNVAPYLPRIHTARFIVQTMQVAFLDFLIIMFALSLFPRQNGAGEGMALTMGIGGLFFIFLPIFLFIGSMFVFSYTWWRTRKSTTTTIVQEKKTVSDFLHDFPGIFIKLNIAFLGTLLLLGAALEPGRTLDLLLELLSQIIT